MNNRVRKNLLRQTAVYWGSPVNDGYGGKTFAGPVEVQCRWMIKQEKIVLQNMEEVRSKAVVALSDDVEVGGRLALTDLDNLNSSQLPEDEESYEIMKFSKNPDPKANVFVRTAWLI